jgi:hypothetical protein
VCRGLDPQPQFQIIRIERIRGYDDYAHYRFINEPFENVEWNIIYQGNSEDVYMGQMTVVRGRNNPNDQPTQVRFQIRNIFLASRNEIFPVVMFDDISALPHADSVIIPRNARNHNPYGRNDPNFTTHYLMDRENFFIETVGLSNRVIDRLDEYRNHPFHHTRERNWYERHDDDQYHNNEYARDYDRDIEYYRPNRFIAAGAGAGEPRTRRRSVPRTPPRVVREVPDMPPVAAASTSRPVSLHAFTIQALINHAISENMTCPISMNPIDKSTACVTTCQHIFERDSIAHWLADHANCPVCRQTTSICN